MSEPDSELTGMMRRAGQIDAISRVREASMGLEHLDGGTRSVPEILHAIELVDQHLDDAAPQVYRQDPAASAELNEARGLANMWRRSYGGVSEAAETQDALVGVTGGNPRKGIYATRDEMLDEAGDTAVSALLFIQSQTKDTGCTWQVFLDALAKAESRVPPAFPQGRSELPHPDVAGADPDAFYGDLDEPGHGYLDAGDY
jgi:hypothetical protein